ncbi:ninjurin-A-like isoform X4 [Amphibalanus amphitrite]|uniref:ninjurin-A-like isoform X4 n=1 Tax=Amphibalanus amphitrite TaxID=1232801 RepID=UPI001C901F3A|nr:ninjurin-A-like isoform X4 [Amphibalanus amphitrite]XP_043243763.1 ninjurin-A-like isoform X4 [Amphibalanus amphitrite]
MASARVGTAEFPEPRKTLDPNRYATKKTIAQGMLDVALLTANASQLRYVLQVGEEHEFYTLMVTLISLSIILQVLIGVLSLSLNLLRDCRMDREDYARSANGINYTTLAFVFVITTTNVLISAFDVRPVGTVPKGTVLSAAPPGVAVN